jgi:tRNA-dihydrouridine synthase A
MLDYTAAELARGTKLSAITRHMTGLLNGLPGARRFRRLLTEESVKPGAGLEVLHAAIEAARGAEARLAAEDAAFAGCCHVGPSETTRKIRLALGGEVVVS